MSVRLEVLLEEDEMDEIQERARAESLSVNEWVRRRLRLRGEALLEREARARKLEAIERAATFDFPTGDIEQMLEEIAQGRSGARPLE